jgi:hypothetical protein
MKIIGFAQLRNELEKGNLENWFKCMVPICDYIYIYDQNSIDGSLEYYSIYEKVSVISSPTNRFREEMICKDDLLQLIKKDHPDTDWIFALDGDTLMDGRLLKNNGDAFKTLCAALKDESYDGYVMGFKNLWRSDTYVRHDSDYNWPDNNGVCPLWRFKLDMHFEVRAGLHISASPISVKHTRRLDYALVHRGFSTDKQILDKYDLYGGLGQTGYLLDRFLEEGPLAVTRIDSELLPDWLEITDDVNPLTKRKLRDIYNETRRR